MQMVLVAWKYFTMENGEQSVMVLGILMMPKLDVGNLVIHMPLAGP